MTALPALKTLEFDLPAAYPVPPLAALIGNTPLLELRHVTSGLSPRVSVYAKAEWYNPGGSIKDRAAWFMLRQAIVDGQLAFTPPPAGGKGEVRRALDATSGNTGIALAMLGATLKIGVTLCLPANASPERKRILAAYGAEIIYTDPMHSTDGAQRVARELAERQPEKFYYLNQYANPANAQAHTATTGPEIWRQTRGQVTHFVAGLGTTGTFVGTGRFLKARAPHVRLYSLQPDGPLHGLEGLKHLPSVHVPQIYDPTLADGNLDVATEEAYAMLKRLATEEGLLVGVSSAAAAVACLKLAETLDEGVVVTVFPDAADKYLSLPVWDSR